MKLSQVRLINQILLTIFSVLYPFGVVFKNEILIYIAIILAILWALKWFLEKKQIYLFIAIFFIFIAFIKNMAFFYPVLVNLLMLFLFATSLKNEAIITRFARLKHHNLPKIAIKYTRNLTKIWSIFFIINAFLSFILIYIDEKFWAFYCGFISYVLIFLLLGGEIIFRRIFIKNV